MSLVFNGPGKMGTQFGKMSIGESNFNLDQSLLVPSLLNIAATGYIVNMVRGSQPSDKTGYLMSFSGQLLYGILMGN